METVAISGAKRTSTGKKSAKAVRNSGSIPCVIYGGKENVHFTGNISELKKMIYTPAFKVAEINIDGSPHKCILKDVQFHPVTDEVKHVDFLELVNGKPLKVELPVRLEGVAPGIREGGKLVYKLRKVKVKTTPEVLVDELVLDISEMNLGDSVRVRDIAAIEGMELMSSPALPVASVITPRALKSAEAATEATEEEGAEGEEAAAEGGEKKEEKKD